MNSGNFEIKHTEEELAHYERKLSAEILKCKAAIDRKKLYLEELQSKVFKNKKNIKEAEDELIELENLLIDLQSMTALDYLLLLQGNGKREKKLNVHGVMNNIGSAVETISKFIPARGISEIGKLSGKFIKSVGKNKK